MLQNIRDNIQGIFAKIIMAIIIVPFALFGIDSLLSGGGVVNVAEVNGEEIAELELQQMMVIQKRSLLSRMGENADPSLLDDALIREQVLQRLIQEKVLLQKAKAGGIGLSDRQLDQAIVSMGQFQQDGQFSPDLYQATLRNNGYTSPFFKQLLSKELLLKQLSSAVSSTGFVTETELADIAAIVGEKRSYRYVLLPLVPDVDTTVDPAQVDNYYQQHLAEFQREEQLQLEYIELKKEQFYKPVDEQRLREAFDIEMSEFKASEERRVSHIFIEINEARSSEQALALANELEQQLSSGGDFGELAKTNSDDIGSASIGGDLGYTRGDTFPEEFEEVLFSLELDAVSSAVATDDGFHLIKLTDVKVLDKPVFENRRLAIEQRIQSAEADAGFITTLEDLRDYVFNSDDLAGPAKSLELSVGTTNWLSRSSTDGLFSKNTLKNAAFSNEVLEEENNSEVIELSPNHYVVLRLKSHREAEALPLAEVETQIQALLQQKQAREELQSQAQRLSEQLEGGSTIEEIAQLNGYEWQLEIDRSRNSSAVNRELLGAAFNAVELNGYAPINLDDGSMAIIKVEKIEAGSVQLLAKDERRAVTQEVIRTYAAWDFSWFIQSAMAESDISTL